jgi:hypothetical protein
VLTQIVTKLFDPATNKTFDINTAAVLDPSSSTCYGDWQHWWEQVFHPVREHVKEDDESLAAIGLYTITAGVLSRRGDVYKGAAVGKLPEPV